MKFEEKIYNTDNLSIKDIDEKTTRARDIIVNSNKEVLMCYSDGRNHQEYLGGHLEFSKNYHSTGKNRLVEIYYTDLDYDASETKLDEDKKYKNYKCRYTGIEELKNILFENKQTTRETNSSLDDTILVYEEFLSRNNYGR